LPLLDQLLERPAVRGQQFLDPLTVDVRHDDLADLVVDLRKDALRLNSVRLDNCYVGL